MLTGCALLRCGCGCAWGLGLWARYDAITCEGLLVHQDGLTPLNAPFFDAADTLFVNYRWQVRCAAAR